jgi:hypothetical protein
VVFPPFELPPLPPLGPPSVEDEQEIGTQQTTMMKGTDLQNPTIDLA